MVRGSQWCFLGLVVAATATGNTKLTFTGEDEKEFGRRHVAHRVVDMRDLSPSHSHKDRVQYKLPYEVPLESAGRFQVGLRMFVGGQPLLLAVDSRDEGVRLFANGTEACSAAEDEVQHHKVTKHSADSQRECYVAADGYPFDVRGHSVGTALWCNTTQRCSAAPGSDNFNCDKLSPEVPVTAFNTYSPAFYDGLEYSEERLEGQEVVHLEWLVSSDGQQLQITNVPVKLLRRFDSSPSWGAFKGVDGVVGIAGDTCRSVPSFFSFVCSVTKASVLVFRISESPTISRYRIDRRANDSQSVTTSRLLLADHGTLAKALDSLQRPSGGSSTAGTRHIYWSEPRSTGVFGIEKRFVFDIYRPQVCDIDILDQTSSHWTGLLDFGSSCLVVPRFFMKRLAVWLPLKCPDFDQYDRSAFAEDFLSSIHAMAESGEKEGAEGERDEFNFDPVVSYRRRLKHKQRRPTAPHPSEPFLCSVERHVKGAHDSGHSTHDAKDAMHSGTSDGNRADATEDTVRVQRRLSDLVWRALSAWYRPVVAVNSERGGITGNEDDAGGVQEGVSSGEPPLELPTLTFRLSEEGHSLRLRLEQLVFWHEPSKKEMLCVVPQKAKTYNGHPVPSTVNPVLGFGVYAMNQFTIVIDQKNLSIGFLPNEEDFEFSDDDAAARSDETGSCASRRTCIGAQTFDPTSNTCKDPECAQYYLMTLDKSSGTCAYRRGVTVFIISIVITLAVAELSSYVLYNYAISKAARPAAMW